MTTATAVRKFLTETDTLAQVSKAIDSLEEATSLAKKGHLVQEPRHRTQRTDQRRRLRRPGQTGPPTPRGRHPPGSRIHAAGPVLNAAQSPAQEDFSEIRPARDDGMRTW